MRLILFCTLLLWMVADAAPSREENSHSKEDIEQRSFSAEIACKRSLKSVAHNTWLRAHQPDGQWKVDMAPHVRAAEHWLIEEHGGKVALKSPFCHDYYLYADPVFYVNLTQELLPSTLWTPFKIDDGSWSFQSVHGSWLSADSNGSVYTVTEDIDEWEHFWLESIDETTSKPSPSATPNSIELKEDSEEDDRKASLSVEIAGKRTLKSAHGTYIRHVNDPENGWTVDAVPHCLACEQWTVLNRQGKVALQLHCNREYSTGYLRANADGLVAVAVQEDEDTLWTPIKNEDGSWMFRSKHGRFLSADKNNGAVYTVTEHIDFWENFWLGSWPDATPPAKAAPSTTPGEGTVETENSSQSDDMPLDQLFEVMRRIQGAFDNSDQRTAKDTSRDDAVVPDPSTKGKTADVDNEKTKIDPSLSAEVAGKRTIKGHYNAYLRAWANSTDWFVGAATQCKECEQWYIEDHNGKVALKAYCSDKYLRSNEGRYVDLGDKPEEHELWKPIKNEDGSWSFQGHHGTWLRAQPHGRVSLQTELFGGDEKFWLGKWTGKFDEIEGARSLKSTPGTYLRASYCASDIDSTIVDMSVHLKACEKWQIQLKGKKVSLLPNAEPGKYLRAYSDGSVGLAKNGSEVGERELWTPLKHADGSWSLKSAHGKLLSAAYNGTVTTVVDNMAEENFWIEKINE